MTQRLPVTGGDAGAWGPVLLGHLRVGHNEDGTHKPVPGTVAPDRVFNPLAYAQGVAIGDGASHLLSASFATLAAAQAVYPHATALTQELAWAAIQAAINAMTVNPGTYPTWRGELYIPAGIYRINDTIVVDNVYGPKVGGAGIQSTRFYWTGAADRPMWRVTNVYQGYFAHFQLFASTSAPLAVGIAQYNASNVTGKWNPTQNHYAHIEIDGNTGGVYSCFRSGVTSGRIDANNDFTHWTHCTATNYRDYGWEVEGTQCYGNEMIHCRALSSVGKAAVRCAYRASFKWRGGGTFAHQVADFLLEEINDFDTTRIEGVNSEGSKRFVDLQSYHAGHLVVEGSRFTSNDVHADGQFIRASGNGILTLRDNHWIELTATKLRCQWGAALASAVFVYERNTWLQDPANRPAAPEGDPYFFSGRRPTRMADSAIINSSSLLGIIHPVLPFNLIVDSDPTPSVREGEDYYLAYGSGITITNFLDGYQGKRITLRWSTSAATLQHNTNLILRGGVNFVGSTNAMMRLCHTGTAWVEESRSVV